MTLLKHFLLSIPMAVGITMATQAETVLFYETFDNGDYNESFPYVLDKDDLPANPLIRDLFYSSAADSYQPWWMVRDSTESTDLWMASHSYYMRADQSSDWLISRAIVIPTEGFVLSMDAQSVRVREDVEPSDLSLYVTEILIDPVSLPKTPTHVWEKIPFGEDPDALEDGGVVLTYDLSKYAGKTIYINLVNENIDKDIVAINNVKVSRPDSVDLVFLTEDVVDDQDVTIDINVSTAEKEDLINWVLKFDDGVHFQMFSGEMLEAGSVQNFCFNMHLELGETREYTVSLVAENQPELVYEKSITCYAFIPERKILFEESTGTWCGYCPIGIYTIESMMEDEVLKDRIVPVSVHYPGAGDYMVVDDYAENLMNYTSGTTAPAFRVNRIYGINGTSAYDYNYDPENPRSITYKVYEQLNKRVPLEIKVEGSYNINGLDTLSVAAKATVRAAMNLSGDRYKIGFILKENNVGMRMWEQYNYMSKNKIESKLNGWTELPEKVRDYRWQDVARMVSGFYGMPGSLPRVVPADQEVTFEHTLVIPETRKYDIHQNLVAPAIARDYLILVAYVIDIETGEIVNVDEYPMTDIAEDRYTTKMYLEASGIDDIVVDGTDATGTTEYYDLLGRRISKPSQGVFITRTGTKAEKVVIK